MAISFTDQRLSPQADSRFLGLAEGFVEFTARFDRCLVHGLGGSLFTQFPVRQFEATPISCFHSQLVPQFHCRALQILCCILHGFVHFNGSVADGQ